MQVHKYKYRYTNTGTQIQAKCKIWGKISAKNWKNLTKYLNMIEFFSSNFDTKLIQFLYFILDMKE